MTEYEQETKRMHAQARERLQLYREQTGKQMFTGEELFELQKQLYET